jgi:hypothetical protein
MIISNIMNRKDRIFWLKSSLNHFHIPKVKNQLALVSEDMQFLLHQKIFMNRFNFNFTYFLEFHYPLIEFSSFEA